VKEARRAALIAAVVAAALAAAKTAIGLATGSLVILAAAVDNVLDLTCSGINVFFLGLAAKPPDREHKFGHGKAEALSGVIQATLIAGGGAVLAGHSVWEIVTGARVQRTMPGMVVAGISLGASVILGLFLTTKARKLRSVALRADAFHYLTDIATNMVALVALWLVRATGVHAWDPVGSLLISLYIIFEAVKILRVAADEVLDRGLPLEAELAVKEIVDGLGPEVRGVTGLRTRRAGRTVFVELRLQLDPRVSFTKSHVLTEDLISRLRDHFGADTQVMVDTDPVPGP